MGWLKDRWGVIEDARNHRAWILAIATTIFVSLADPIVLWVRDQVALLTGGRRAEISPIFGAPLWAWAGIGFFLLTSWWLLEYGLRLQKKLTPRFEIGFDPDAGCLVRSILKFKNVDGSLHHESEAVYVRGLVKATARTQLESCAAYLTGIKKRDAASGVFVNVPWSDDLQLPWSITNRLEVSVPSEVRRYFNIVRVEKKKNELELPEGVLWPLRLRGLFDDKTTYRLALSVVGDRITRTKEIEVHWSGKWDGISASVVKNIQVINK